MRNQGGGPGMSSIVGLFIETRLLAQIASLVVRHVAPWQSRSSTLYHRRYPALPWETPDQQGYEPEADIWGRKPAR